jgi:hypothetical protein
VPVSFERVADDLCVASVIFDEEDSHVRLWPKKGLLP